jgi:hypothetical protein
MFNFPILTYKSCVKSRSPYLSNLISALFTLFSHLRLILHVRLPKFLCSVTLLSLHNSKIYISDVCDIQWHLFTWGKRSIHWQSVGNATLHILCDKIIYLNVCMDSLGRNYFPLETKLFVVSQVTPFPLKSNGDLISVPTSNAITSVLATWYFRSRTRLS